ncbi:MAG: hypothetical protein D6805_05005 [Planctomycetota bacterium]|nr:MAG: hypothetical protein D6805_05005 [Planctomycetota bacterium]
MNGRAFLSFWIVVWGVWGMVFMSGNRVWSQDKSSTASKKPEKKKAAAAKSETTKTTKKKKKQFAKGKGKLVILVNVQRKGKVKLTKTMLRNIFLKKTPGWHPKFRSFKSQVNKAFLKTVVKMSVKNFDLYWEKFTTFTGQNKPRQYRGAYSVIRKIGKDKMGIGFLYLYEWEKYKRKAKKSNRYKKLLQKVHPALFLEVKK